MSRNNLNLSVLILIVFISNILYAQEDYYVNQSKFLQKTNSSYLGFNQLNKVGVLYNTSKINNLVNMENKYVFGSLSFQDRKFSLGFDLNSFKMSNTGLTQAIANLSYIYVIQFDSETYFLPSVSVGLGNSNINFENLIFEDQLDTQTGFINTETIDPLGPLIGNSNFFDLGASFLLHSNDYLIGLSFKHLNRPNISFNKEVIRSKPISYSLQLGYEFNINPYENNFLPRYSFLYTFGSFTKYGETIFINLSQDFQLGEFSIGLVQTASSIKSFFLNNIGFTLGLNLENFDFGINYNFPIRKIGKVYSPSVFEISVIFDFSIYRRNNRGLYKRLQIDNYY